MSAYTDADVQAAAVALWGEGEPAFAYLQKNYPKTAANTTDAVSRILDAVASAIAARALREAAEVLPCATEGPDRIGTARWKQAARNGYSIAIEEAQIALRHRADEIEHPKTPVDNATVLQHGSTVEGPSGRVEGSSTPPPRRSDARADGIEGAS